MRRTVIIATILLTLVLCHGCTKDNLHVERILTDGTRIIVDLDIEYLAQKKSIKKLEYNVDTGIFLMESFGSDDSELVINLRDLLLGIAAAEIGAPAIP